MKGHDLANAESGLAAEAPCQRARGTADASDRRTVLRCRDKLIDQLSRDLKHAFPEITGFSARNLKYMRALAAAWPDEAIVQQAVAQLPWGHNVRILDKVKDRHEREWYTRACVEHGWSRAVLEAQIDTGLFRRQGRAITNFERTLPSPQSELAQQSLKDPYCFEFLGLAEQISERELHQSLIENLRDFPHTACRWSSCPSVHGKFAGSTTAPVVVTPQKFVRQPGPACQPLGSQP